MMVYTCFFALNVLKFSCTLEVKMEQLEIKKQKEFIKKVKEINIDSILDSNYIYEFN